MSMEPSTFADFVENEKERLATERERILAEQIGLQEQINEIDRELAAITAYEATKAGKTASPAAGRGRRGSGVRTRLLSLIGERTGGISRAEILESLGMKGNKAKEQSVSNALAALKRGDQITNSDGKYYPAEA
ncbi:MAG: hypothetical protein GKR94_04835 [Gammaproteobacteria bacterium]|nr:hypothetical protein [Gammaproteobacteria bacterium]